VYAVNKDNVDFALLRVDRKLRLDPALPFYGGPTKIAAPAQVEQVHVWSPPGLGIEPSARSGVCRAVTTGAELVTATTLTSFDTGATVQRPDGAAIGYVSVMAYPATVQLLDPALYRAQRYTRLKLRLLTAKVA
jgi:hypothetical protein